MNQQKGIGQNLNQLSRPDGNDSGNARSLGAYGVGAKQVSSDVYKEVQGRYPANLLLEHHPECDLLGMKKSGSGAKRVNDKTEICAGVHEGYQRPNASCLTHKIPGQVRQYGEEQTELWQCHVDCPIRMLDEQSGQLKSGTGAVKRRSSKEQEGNTGAAYGAESRPEGTPMIEYGDVGGASRFFYCSKASKSDRGEGNNHPTVKNTRLVNWLVKLITKPGGIVLDPFLGSGTTAVVCKREGFSCIGIEQSAEYMTIAKRRVAS